MIVWIRMSKPKQDNSIKIPDNILKQLLTSSEIRMLKNRFQIVSLLEEGLSIRNISKKVKVGTDTVVRVARMVEKNSLYKSLNKSARKFKTNTPWIFGKSE